MSSWNPNQMSCRLWFKLVFFKFFLLCSIFLKHCIVNIDFKKTKFIWFQWPMNVFLLLLTAMSFQIMNNEWLKSLNKHYTFRFRNWIILCINLYILLVDSIACKKKLLNSVRYISNIFLLLPLYLFSSRPWNQTIIVHPLSINSLWKCK